MKKAVLILILITSSLWVSAQKIQLGPNIGGNYAIFPVGIGVEYDGASLGYNFGLSGQIHLKNKFYLSPEINFEHKVYRSKIGDSFKAIQRGSSVIISTPAKYVLGKDKNFYFYVGPYIAYLLKYDYTLYFVNNENYYQNLTHKFQRYELGFLVGLGYSRPITDKMTLFIDANYSESLYHFGSAEYKGNSKLRAIRLRLGCLFTIK